MFRIFFYGFPSILCESNRRTRNDGGQSSNAGKDREKMTATVSGGIREDGCGDARPKHGDRDTLQNGSQSRVIHSGIVDVCDK